MGVEIRSDEITPYLERFAPQKVGQFLGRTRERLGAVAAEGSRGAYGASSFPFSKTGNLFGSIGWRAMKDETIVGFVAGPMRGQGARAYHRHLVEMGTGEHATWPVKRQAIAWTGKDGRRRFSRGVVPHPGAKPNPWMTRGTPGIVEKVTREFDRAVKEEMG